MKYIDAPDLKERMVDIVKTLELDHVDVNRVECMRSLGSSTKRTLARCHTIGKVMQKAMKVKAFYAIEFLEKFEKLSRKDQDKVIIHELLHIPKTFGGGFRQHDFVCEENVELLYDKFMSFKQPSRPENSLNVKGIFGFRWADR
jgi:predicted metallopeptidase